MKLMRIFIVLVASLHTYVFPVCKDCIESEMIPAVVDVISVDGNKDSDQAGMKKDFTNGSGIIVSERDGYAYILTSQHIIGDARVAKVVINDDLEFLADVVGVDTKYDVALLKVKNPPKNLKCAVFADSDKIKVCDRVVAIGNPFRIGKSVSCGVVSSTARSLSYDKNPSICDEKNLILQYIQTDAHVNFGNSGGPLFSLEGTKAEVIGMINLCVTPSDNYGYNTGISFAIPSNVLVKLIQSIEKYGRVRRSTLGIKVVKLDPNVQDALVGKKVGCSIIAIQKDSPATRAGIQLRDIVLEVNDQEITNNVNIDYILDSLPIGKVVPITVLRLKNTMKFSITVEESKDSDQDADTDLMSKSSIKVEQIDKIGIGVADITPDLRRHFNIPSDINGVIAVDLSSCSSKDISYGDVIMQINQEVVGNANDIKKSLKDLKLSSSYVALYVYSINRPAPFYVPIKIINDEYSINKIKSTIMRLISSDKKQKTDH